MSSKKLYFIPMKRLIYIFLACLCLPMMVGCNDLETMAKHYEIHHKDISELRHYASIVLNDSCSLRLEIDQRGITMFASASKEEKHLIWSDDYEQKLPSIGLTTNELDSIVFLLKKADCIGIDVYSSNVIQAVWYRRPNFFGLYSYVIFEEPISDNKWNNYLDDYSAVPYCDTVVFRYGGAAFGADVIPECDRVKFIKKHHIEKK